ncbi:FAD-dependent oxidoreductase [Oceaniglobus trochenteri]|uniref:FAD-dependent oxidoreductase n=1 Tax=Oceaniglobus trochenteri TaxID=2763260 RepID=UPI001CFFA39C|nr:FAD-dependent oxidoreductase [Oceaniglobus trochenteri]
MVPETFTFTFDGQEVSARRGDSIAAALAAAGTFSLGRRMSARARGVYCGMGACQDCLVTVDGHRSLRACMAEAEPGMNVGTQDDGSGAVIPAPGDAPAATDRTCDLAIVGAGPAGLEAAIAATEVGLTVLVIDERSAPGGQYFKPPSDGSRKPGRDRQHRRGDALRDRFAACGATLIDRATVWFARGTEDGFVLRFTRDGTETRVTAATAILATGAHERPAPVPGWTAPGVMTIGAAQTLARRYGVAPGKRILIAGQGPLGLQLAVELMEIGADVVGVAERSAMPLQRLIRIAMADPGLAASGAGYLLRLRRAGVPLWRTSEVTAIGAPGTDGLRDVTLASTGGGDIRNQRADAVCMGDGFVPQIELARLLGCPLEPGGTIARAPDGATARPGLWVAGDGGGLGGAQAAMAQGRLAGLSAARHLGRDAPEDGATVRRLTRAQRFQAALWSAYSAPTRAAPTGDTIVCRCETVTAGQIGAAINAGATDPGAIKRSTRCGMGRCQGRFCTPTLLSILQSHGVKTPPAALAAPQLPARPVRAGQLLREKPEWGGHREARPSARPEPPATAPLPISRADVVVIGAGVTGLAAARHAALSGASVLCLERGRAGAEASGGNAGSLHLQLLSWDFGAKAVAGGSPALRTLPLQAESIALWSKLEQERGDDFEMKVTGGLMLAENPDQIEFLTAKARAEGKVGIETHVIGKDDIARIAPALSDRFVAAAWCPGEGKINPLAANDALLAATRDVGAVVAERCPVLAIERDGDGYAVATAGGTIHATRIVIAAGGWSAQPGAMLGVSLPIRGAPLQMIVTEPAPPLVPCLVAHADRHLTLKQATAGGLLIGGAWPASVNASGQSEVLPESLEGNLWVAARTVPAVGGLSVVRSWAAMNIDIDGAPLLSHLPGHPNVVVAATANGYTLGPLVGREAATGVLGGRMRNDLQEFDLTRFNT